MALDESTLGTSDAAPELQLLKARRMYLLFRWPMYICVLIVASATLWMFSHEIANFIPLLDSQSPTIDGPMYHLYQADKISVAAQICIVFSSLVLFGSLIPLRLETGVTAKDWPAVYRNARNTLDQYKAQKIEETSIARRWAATQETEGHENADARPKGALGANLTEMRVAADLREAERWVASNYPALTRAIIERLQSEISTQGSRANINLSIALVVASVGVVILGWLSSDVSSMLLRPPPKNEYAVMLYTGAFTAKLTLALSANVFALFFLATYRRNLSEIRYFHNELTNIQIRILALYVAADRNIDSSLALAIKGLSATERNFILKKGESTTDLSLKNLDSTEISTLTTLFKEVVQVAQKRQDGPPTSQ